MSCQAVKVSADTGGCQRRLSTVPKAIDTAAAMAAAMPSASSAAFGVSTSSATPPMPTTAATTDSARTGEPRKTLARNTTKSGCTEVMVAATPPGSR